MGLFDLCTAEMYKSFILKDPRRRTIMKEILEGILCFTVWTFKHYSIIQLLAQAKLSC